MDHIIGCAYADQSLFSVKWIAPAFLPDKLPSTNQSRLANYLDHLGNLYFVDRNQNTNPIATINCQRNVKINLWLGNGKDPAITTENKKGLFLNIEGGKYSHILLAGDVPYQCMGALLSQNKVVQFMHVPHHGSNMDNRLLTKLPQTRQNGGICAVISTNRESETGNLNIDSCHEKNLKTKFKDVTAVLSHIPPDDEANLSLQINYRTSKYKFR